MDHPSASVASTSTVSVSVPAPLEDSDSDSRDVDKEAIRYAARAAADLKRATLSEFKQETMEQEAKKISSAYREEQQKHDLAMRLEQVTSPFRFASRTLL
jgi:exonuclease V gamma subunit